MLHGQMSCPGPRPPNYGRKLEVPLMAHGRMKISAIQDCSDDEIEKLFILPIEETKRPVERMEIRGILLQPTNTSKGEYQRVGYFVFFLAKRTPSFWAMRLGTSCEGLRENDRRVGQNIRRRQKRNE